MAKDEEKQLKYVIEKMRTIRIEKGVSQMELSLRSDLSQSFIATVEKGKKQPSVLTLLKIAKALEVNPRDFFPEVFPFTSKEQVKQNIRNMLDLL